MDLQFIQRVFKVLSNRNSLSDYLNNRDISRSSEPAPSIDPSVNGKAVIQLHAAKWAGSHYDWRLGCSGVLKSFMTRRIPDIGESVIAITSEDYPASYLTFTGSISDGSYGAGEVSIYDLGSVKDLTITPELVTFELRGGKVTGKFSMSALSDTKYTLKRESL